MPTTPEPTGETPLMMAAQVGVLAVVEQLLKHGARVDVRDPKYGQTALIFAARAGQADDRFSFAHARREPQRRHHVGEPPAFIEPNSVPGFGLAWASSAAVCLPTAGGASLHRVA